MTKGFKRISALLLTATLTVGMAAGAGTTAYASDYNDFDYITSHVSTAAARPLKIARPSGNISTSLTAYYLTGSSNPDFDLYLNGERVENRGSLGSFGVYVALEAGDNYFEFTQDDGAVQSVTITQGSGYTASAGKTETVSAMYPSYDRLELGGETVTLQCVGPAGASIAASIGGERYPLRQVAAAQTGVPAKFTAEYTVPSYSQTTDLGAVTYTMDYQGATKTFTAGGKLFAGGDTVLVRVSEPSVSVFSQAATNSDFVATAKLGATDRVVDAKDNMYQLGMGGWINRDAVQPLTGGSYQNEVSGVTFQASAGGESFRFAGTAQPVVSGKQGDGTLTVKLHNTTGVNDVPVGDSQLFTGVDISEEDGATTLVFQRGSLDLWGYVVEYKDNVTTLYCKYKPSLSGSEDKPLSNLHVVVDAGHGGTDPGALGIMNNQGLNESAITADTAVAVQKRLESLGAKVTLVGSGTSDNKSSYLDRMQTAYADKADFFLSLHCNSIGDNQNGLKPAGAEVFYYESTSKPFSETLLRHIVAETGRASRGVKWNNFRVTLNSCAPSVLVEMGFITNPRELDDMASKQGIFNMANAIGDSLVSYLA